ncbi:MAG: YkgJ family cysteine cluster protein [Candidatus Thorarchaeota archaeon]
MTYVDEISEVITKAVFEFKEVFDSLCTHCGECCRGQAIFLTDVDAPIVAQCLKELEGNLLVKKHLSTNSTIFDKWHKYVLQFDEDCPFLDNERCSIYSKKPLTCQLYPMSIIGFIDRPSSNVKEVYIEIAKPLESHACLQFYNDLVEIGNRVFGSKPGHADQILRLLASTMVDMRGLGYLFGQAPKRGEDAVMLDNGNPSPEEVEMAIVMHYEKRFKKQPSVNFLKYSDVIDDDDIDRLTSDLFSRKSTRKTTKRISRIKKSKPNLMAFYEDTAYG